LRFEMFRLPEIKETKKTEESKGEFGLVTRLIAAHAGRGVVPDSPVNPFDRVLAEQLEKESPGLCLALDEAIKRGRRLDHGQNSPMQRLLDSLNQLLVTRDWSDGSMPGVPETEELKRNLARVNGFVPGANR